MAEMCGTVATDCQLCDTRVTLSGNFDRFARQIAAQARPLAEFFAFE